MNRTAPLRINRPKNAAIRHMGRKAISPPGGPRIHFTTGEIISILVSMITMVLAFYMFNITEPGIIIGVVLGILLHEIAHKLVAQSMGFTSKYKLWEIGLVLVIAFAIISRGKIIFAAPGFVVTEGIASIRERGIIALSAPFANIIIAIFFLAIGGPFALAAAYINLLLAAFNLLPIGPLDGNQVMKWNPTVWSTCYVVVIILGTWLLI